MLLRLRQVCSHTSLIAEDHGVIADEDLNDAKPEARDELIRAQMSLSREFVVKIKETLRKKAMQRIAAEKEVCYVIFSARVHTCLTRTLVRGCCDRRG